MKIVLAGSGNVATHLALALQGAGLAPHQVWSPTAAHAALLAERIQATAISTLEAIDRDADLYIIAVKDEAIVSVATALRDVQGAVVHTSGTTSMEVLNTFRHYGVFYPLQTFSKSRAVNFATIPLCIEASDAGLLSKLENLAHQLSGSVYEVSSPQRKALHVAAVFANNFSNHLFHIAEGILAGENLPFDLLRPLILETAGKVQQDNPANMQTGPAVRGDERTVHEHLAWLHDKPEWAALYAQLSDSIKKTRK